MKILRWIVVIKRDPSCFYLPVSKTKFLSGIQLEDNCLIPIWGDEPVLYKYKYARFQVSELRRVGYNVSVVPYVLIMIRNWIAARKLRKW